MAKAVAATPSEHKPAHERSGGWDRWELDDAMRTIHRAVEIISNKKFLEAVRKHAEDKADEHREMAHKVGQLVKGGKISPKALEKMENR